MKNYLGAAALLLSMATAVWADPERLITTTGQGSVEAAPDMATINLGVTHEAKTAGQALAATSQAVSDIISRLQASGIEARDMQTQGLSVQPVWSGRNSSSDAPPQISGFVARNGLMVRVRDLDALGGILDEVVQDGANTFDGLQFSLQDPASAMAAAREAAVKDAMEKAGQLAQAAGVSLGAVRSISENGGAARPMMMEMASARMAADVPIAAGEVSLSAQVSMVFEIAD